MIDLWDEADAVVDEHLAWCRARGISAWEVLRSVGIGPTPEMSMDEARGMLANVWLGIAAERRMAA